MNANKKIRVISRIKDFVFRKKMVLFVMLLFICAVFGVASCVRTCNHEEKGTAKSFRTFFPQIGIHDERILAFPAKGEFRWNRLRVLCEWSVTCYGKVDSKAKQEWYNKHVEKSNFTIIEGYDDSPDYHCFTYIEKTGGRKVASFEFDHERGTFKFHVQKFR